MGEVRIHVRGYLTFRSSIGDETLTFSDESPPTLGELLHLLQKQRDSEHKGLLLDVETGKPKPGVTVLVNGRGYAHTPEGLTAALKDGDEVAIFPPIAGGCHV